MKNGDRELKQAARSGRLPPAEAAILEDMFHAGFPAAETQARFTLRYLPPPVKLPGAIPDGDLLASRADIAAARRRLKSDPLSARIWTELQSRCDGYLRRGSPTFIDWKEQRQPQLWKKRQGHWLFSKALQDLAWSWTFSGDYRYADAARGILLAIARARTGWHPSGCNYGRPYNGWLNDNLLDIGPAALGPAIAYNLLRSRFPAADRAEVAAYFEPFFYRALTHRYYGMDKPGHNFAPIGFGGIGLLALALAGDIPAARRDTLEQVMAWSEAYARFTLDTVGGADGAAVEGSAYGSASLHYVALLSQALQRRLGRNLFAHPAWGRFARYLAMETLPGGGAFNNFNDNHYRTHAGFWPLVAHGSGDPAGHWIWRTHQLAEGADAWLNLTRSGMLSDLPYLLLFRDPAADALTPRKLKLPVVKLFPEQQHLVIRTGWEKNDLHVTFQCTRGRSGGHSQADRLNFTAYALGERFVVDSGYGTQPIPGSTEVKRTGALADSHNQVLIDGKGQVRTTAPRAGQIIRWEKQGDWVWALGDAAEAYEKTAVARRLIAVRQNAAEPCIVIADWVVPASPGTHRFNWLLHTGAGNTFVPGKAGAFVIRGAQGQSLQGLHLPVGTGRMSQAPWIDHPRLDVASSDRAFLALTVLATRPVKKGPSTASSRSVQWQQGSDVVTASLTWRQTARGPARPRLECKTLGLKLDLF